MFLSGLWLFSTLAISKGIAIGYDSFLPVNNFV